MAAAHVVPIRRSFWIMPFAAQGERMQVCVQAGIVAAAYLQVAS
jgi:hypothetical protein